MTKACKVNYGVGHASMLVWLQLLLDLHTIISSQTMLAWCGIGCPWVPFTEVEFSHYRSPFLLQTCSAPSFFPMCHLWFPNCLLLQMTVAFTSIMAIFIIERIDERKGMISIMPLVLVGIISIVYWRQACCFVLLFTIVHLLIPYIIRSPVFHEAPGFKFCFTYCLMEFLLL